MNGVVEVVGIHIADGEVQLADEVRTQCLPVALQDVAQIKMLLPVIRDVVINNARDRIVDRFRIAIVA